MTKRWVDADAIFDAVAEVRLGPASLDNVVISTVPEVHHAGAAEALAALADAARSVPEWLAEQSDRIANAFTVIVAHVMAADGAGSEESGPPTGTTSTTTTTTTSSTTVPSSGDESPSEAPPTGTPPPEDSAAGGPPSSGDVQSQNNRQQGSD